jgi:hypothetical protein
MKSRLGGQPGSANNFQKDLQLELKTVFLPDFQAVEKNRYL